ncbi:MAG TPA: L-aspartate oxidase [Thermomicrobiales bacterium]|nr:L-aspartate oxidase [Thermomicrobiales bacterium]
MDETATRRAVGSASDPGDVMRYDVVVIGAGVAGLAFTLRRPPEIRVALVTKGALGESNTRYAQGGLAAAVGADDKPTLHEADTLAAGAGLCDQAAVQALVKGAPAAVAWLLNIGTGFDREGEALLLGREAAHSRRRVLHAGGDATGAEIERALVTRVRHDPRVDIFEGVMASDLLLDGGRCAGVVVDLGADHDDRVSIQAPLVVVAAGGMGQLWATTSNPAGATADGLAMALRAGIAVADLEFMQFHPTVLRVPGSAAFLVSEAVRGEGAYLRSLEGERFMVEEHPLAELAPRDIVARAIQRQMARDESDHVWLDLRHLDAETVRTRFPSIGAELKRRGLDLAADLIPVAPAAHYAMGGIVASPTGETSLPGLLALGEAACTGVHGANRLASNSLLEGLVFGLAAADRLRQQGLPPAPAGKPSETEAERRATDGAHDAAEMRDRLRATMSRHVAVVRDGRGLGEALREIDWIAASVPSARDRATVELANMVVVARTITQAAHRREESRGAHFRADFPKTDAALDGCHLVHDPRADEWSFGDLRSALATPANVAR